MPHFAAVADSKLLKATSKRNRRRSNAPEPLSDCKILSDSLPPLWLCLCVCVCLPGQADCYVQGIRAHISMHTYISKRVWHTCSRARVTDRVAVTVPVAATAAVGDGDGVRNNGRLSGDLRNLMFYLLHSWPRWRIRNNSWHTSSTRCQRAAAF